MVLFLLSCDTSPFHDTFPEMENNMMPVLFSEMILRSSLKILNMNNEHFTAKLYASY